MTPAPRNPKPDERLINSKASTVTKSPSLTMSPRVKQNVGTLPRALKEERHFALEVGLRVSNLGSL